MQCSIWCIFMILVDSCWFLGDAVQRHSSLLMFLIFCWCSAASSRFKCSFWWFVGGSISYFVWFLFNLIVDAAQCHSTQSNPEPQTESISQTESQIAETHSTPDPIRTWIPNWIPNRIPIDWIPKRIRIKSETHRIETVLTKSESNPTKTESESTKSESQPNPVEPNPDPIRKPHPNRIRTLPEIVSRRLGENPRDLPWCSATSFGFKHSFWWFGGGSIWYR